MTDKQKTTIALLGANTVAGHALSLLLQGVGYETKILEGSPPGMFGDPLEGADLLLISPGFVKERRDECLAALGGAHGRMPVLELSSAIKEGLLEGGVETVPWPTNIDALAHEIEAALKGAVHEVRAALGGAEELPPEGESA
ncbi:MAG TPA: hypothetical protein VK869_12885 [Rubrobacteraceae bacterium]|nr:hypothetical protein [Rubrobacteraceae bacterium]